MEWEWKRNKVVMGWDGIKMGCEAWDDMGWDIIERDGWPAAFQQ